MIGNNAITADYVVVGTGLTGSVIARALADAHQDVVVLDRRPRVGGNVADAIHPESCIRFNLHGPHYFRTNDDDLWAYVNRFAAFYPFSAVVKAKVDGVCQSWPVSKDQLSRPTPLPGHGPSPRNFEEAVLKIMDEEDYRRFVYGYTRKQWGIEPRLLSADLARRVEIRNTPDERLTLHRHQGLPRGGFNALVHAMLRDIPCFLKTDYLKQRGAIQARRQLIFTGPLDEFFDFELGRLQYRGQHRATRHFPSRDFILPCGQVNLPEYGRSRAQRIMEWKHMMAPDEQGQAIGTLLTRETACTPENPDDYEYPFPDAENQTLKKRYQERASEFPNVFFCGRLAAYRYYDMDTAITLARAASERILSAADRETTQPGFSVGIERSET